MNPILLQLSQILETAKEGGTMGGQALLFGAVIILGWVVLKLFRAANQTSAEIMAAANSQRDEDRKHHQELVALFRSEREGNIKDRDSNFETLLAIAKDSAVAIALATAANKDTTLVCRETASAIRDLCVAFREMKISAHDDAMNPVQRKTIIVNPPSDPVPIKAQQ